jgi:ribosome biogenesis protein ERB1
MKTVRAIREGRIVLGKPKEEKSRFYSLWSDADAARTDHPMHMPMPKLKLPTHAESYNPPAEYLFTQEEKEEWEKAEPSDRKTDFIPQKYDSLRKVPGYRDFVQQRFDRLLDLYLAPRTRRRRPKLDITDPEELVPKLPDPKELRPFPTHCSVLYPHPNGVRTRCISIDASGMWVVTGADDGEVRLWELATGRCTATWKVSGSKGEKSPVYSVEWSPDRDHLLFAATSDNKITLFSPLDILDPSVATSTVEYTTRGFAEPPQQTLPADVKWSKAKAEADRERGVLVEITVPGTPKQVTWHKRGDYFATVASDGQSFSIRANSWVQKE